LLGFAARRHAPVGTNHPFATNDPARRNDAGGTTDAADLTMRGEQHAGLRPEGIADKHRSR